MTNKLLLLGEPPYPFDAVAFAAPKTAWLRMSLAAALAIACIAVIAATSHAQGFPSAVIPENQVTHVSEHISVIMSFPNVAIVVGDRATLVVDTGMGTRNGAVVFHEAQKLSKGPVLYLTTTHYHPEHAAGEAGFPANTVLLRPIAQQKELEEKGMEFVELFSSRSALNKELLAGVKFRAPDITFEKEIKLDLGGVTARLFWMGAAHTQGDELIDVEPDSALISGDVVQNKLVPSAPPDYSSVKNWVQILAQLRPMKFRYIIPDHGMLGDGSLIEEDYQFLSQLQARTLELKGQGKSADETGQILIAEFKTKFPSWPNLSGNGIPNVVKRVYTEN
jgi:glyoxylase-like metal-dependent hydrolase (beta-lactamase superfamily II)